MSPAHASTNEQSAFHKGLMQHSGAAAGGSLYWNPRSAGTLGGRRRDGMVLEWIPGLLRWLAKPLLVLTMLEQPPVLFDLI